MFTKWFKARAAQEELKLAKEADEKMNEILRLKQEEQEMLDKVIAAANAARAMTIEDIRK